MPEIDLDKINRELDYVIYTSNGDLNPTPIPTENEKDKKIKELEERIKELEDELLDTRHNNDFRD